MAIAALIAALWKTNPKALVDAPFLCSINTRADRVPSHRITGVGEHAKHRLPKKLRTLRHSGNRQIGEKKVSVAPYLLGCVVS